MAQGNVEIWLGSLLRAALSSVHAVLRNAVVCINDPNFELINFLKSFPAQVCVCSLCMYLCVCIVHTPKLIAATLSIPSESYLV